MWLNRQEMAKVIDKRHVHNMMCSFALKNEFTKNINIKMKQVYIPHYNHISKKQVQLLSFLRYVDIDSAIAAYEEALQDDYYRRFRKYHIKHLANLQKIKEYYEQHNTNY